MNATPRIGFIGVGLMGEGMCSCLLKAGYRLTVLAHRSRTRIDKLVAEGAM
jgi:3-hydroxyisobutyrate dehydrogenase-like beta-hydroxyacid dehydrogenase